MPLRRQLTKELKMEKIARTKLENVLVGTGGKFFGVTFKKKDGSLRALHGRMGVTKYLKGGRNNVVKNANSYITVYDMQKKGYRTVNLDTETSVRLAHVEFEVK